MSLMTDKQTLNDLNIFGKAGAEGIYSIFNRTFTRGGALLLEQMFRSPLSDVEEINNRSSTIRFFAEGDIAFPFESAWFDAADQYLQQTDSRTRLNAEDQTLARKFNQLIASDTEFKNTEKGILHLLRLLQASHAFVKKMLQQVKQEHFKQQLRKIAAILEADALMPLQQESLKAKLPYATLAKYDQLLRFRHREEMLKLLEAIYWIDVYASVAKVAKERNYVFPEAKAKEEQLVILEDFYHPALTDPVVNTLEISPGGNIIFLTGANMAGKSTFMKSLGVAMYLAHMGFPVAASKMEFSVRDGIFTTINLPDNLRQGASHFYAEVLRVKQVAQELSRDKYLFVIFDELFRGTNVKDAYEATIAITKGVARRNNCMFIVSTHIMEAGEVLKEACKNIQFLYLPTHLDGTKPVYTHKLTKGITADRHGMIIIENEGIIDMLRKAKQ
ncbi:DNA mismatch repair protein [Chitinophaga caeni]|uniref:DNA mismatch repair protein n=1 Tax=Chitinophaga caeni TaxID=2029983 RepID=A0A291QZ66_9BACT|nr:DNA mismatch repair protein [Chitinophaga caeni]ATL49238.1 DNA mismatch repair protein [Chitinophaga caeni]